MQWTNIESVVNVHHVVGSDAAPDAVPDVLVEVPHAADRRAHYDALHAQLEGPFPDRLHEFFHVNTDVGAWALGLAMARHWVVRRPRSHVVLLECLIPRTFVDCNRRVDLDQEEFVRTGLSQAIPTYVTSSADRRRLTELHAAYVELADAAYAEICGRGGLGINPHTYGPRSLPIGRVDETIVAELRAAHEPEVYAASTLRPHVDVIGRDQQGREYVPPGSTAAVADALRPLGIVVEDSKTYQLHPVTQGWRFATRHDLQVFGFEVRRDLVCAWSPFAEQEIDEPRVNALARAFVEGLDAAWP